MCLHSVCDNSFPSTLLHLLLLIVYTCFSIIKLAVATPKIEVFILYKHLRPKAAQQKVKYFNWPEKYVDGSSKIQTLCHMNQVLLKLRFTAMERLTGY